MKTFQFYTVKSFPTMKAGEVLSSTMQLSMFNERQDIQTQLKLLTKDFVGPLDQFQITSSIVHHAHGVIRVMQNGTSKSHEFSEYLEPVDFFGYYGARDEIFIFEARKEICNGVFRNIRTSLGRIELSRMEVDFVQLRKHEKVGTLCGAWFNQVSAKVYSAGVTGNLIEEDPLFARLSVGGNFIQRYDSLGLQRGRIQSHDYSERRYSFTDETE